MIARSLFVLLFCCASLAQNVVHYTTTNANVKYLFATAEPVLHLKPGEAPGSRGFLRGPRGRPSTALENQSSLPCRDMPITRSSSPPFLEQEQKTPPFRGEARKDGASCARF